MWISRLKVRDPCYINLSSMKNNIFLLLVLFLYFSYTSDLQVFIHVK